MKKIISYLKYLKKLNVVAVKQSLEDEGVSQEDLILMKKITQKAKLDLNVKIGGCEAKNDIYFCEWLNVKGIVAPMVESSYALRKFLQTISKKNKQKLYINLESIQAYHFFRNFLRLARFFCLLDKHFALTGNHFRIKIGN